MQIARIRFAGRDEEKRVLSAMKSHKKAGCGLQRKERERV